VVAVAAVLAAAACGGSDDGAESGQTVTLYTCASEEPVQAVIGAFEAENPDVEIALFRAPTSDLNARVAGDVRSGGLRADVIWGCDPLTMQGFVDQELVGGWVPDNAAEIPEQYRTDDYVGAAVLYIIAVHRDGVPAPSAWSDLADPTYRDAVALPDPSVAASALGALGYFANADGYGIGFYEALKTNGAVQVSTPDEAVTGVAQGTYDAALTIANAAYLAAENGSPIGVVWPEPGAVAVYGPIALAVDSGESAAAQDFISYVVSEPGQQALADNGSYPTMAGIEGPTIPANAPIVFPDWPSIADQRDQLLADYQQVFGG